MATFDLPWSPVRALYEAPGRAVSLLEQWVALTASWTDPVADLGAGAVTALMPDVLMTVLSEGILGRFGGRRLQARLLDHDLDATLEVLKVRRSGAHFQTKTVLSDLRWDTHALDEVTVIAHKVRLVPGLPTRIRTSGVDIEGTVAVPTLIDALERTDPDWRLGRAENGRVTVAHRRRGLTAEVEGVVTDHRLTLGIHRARWRGVPVPRSLLTTAARELAPLPHGARVVHAAREGDLVRFRVEMPALHASFDLAQIRSAILTGTALVVF